MTREYMCRFLHELDSAQSSRISTRVAFAEPQLFVTSKFTEGVLEVLVVQPANASFLEVWGYLDRQAFQFLSPPRFGPGGIGGAPKHVVMQAKQERQRSIWRTTVADAGLPPSSMSLIR